MARPSRQRLSKWLEARSKEERQRPTSREGDEAFFLSPPEEICGMVGTPNSLLD
jgi:hypothetical protein